MHGRLHYHLFHCAIEPLGKLLCVTHLLERISFLILFDFELILGIGSLIYLSVYPCDIIGTFLFFRLKSLKKKKLPVYVAGYQVKRAKSLNNNTTEKNLGTVDRRLTITSISLLKRPGKWLHRSLINNMNVWRYVGLRTIKFTFFKLFKTNR